MTNNPTPDETELLSTAEVIVELARELNGADRRTLLDAQSIFVREARQRLRSQQAMPFEERLHQLAKENDRTLMLIDERLSDKFTEEELLQALEEGIRDISQDHAESDESESDEEEDESPSDETELAETAGDQPEMGRDDIDGRAGARKSNHPGGNAQSDVAEKGTRQAQVLHVLHQIPDDEWYLVSEMVEEFNPPGPSGWRITTVSSALTKLHQNGEVKRRRRPVETKGQPYEYRGLGDSDGDN